MQRHPLALRQRGIPTLSHRQPVNALVMALIFLAPFCCNTSAAAYILPGPAVLERFIHNLGKENRLLVRQQVHVRTDVRGAEEVLANETIRYRFPDAFRSEAVSGAIRRVHLFARGENVTLVDGSLESLPLSRFDRYGELILCRNRSQLERLLLRYGIDPDICSLGRFQGVPHFVIGARYPDPLVSQLWIDKETFWPVRWIFVESSTQAPPESTEIRYLNWSKEGTAWYPHLIEFYRGEVLEKSATVLHLEVDPSFNKELFDAGLLKSEAALPPDSGTPSAESDPKDDEIKKTIEKFKKIYE